MFKRWLFESKVGCLLLGLLERRLGLAVVSADWLADHRCARPAGRVEGH
jgi:hypothetical protein